MAKPPKTLALELLDANIDENPDHHILINGVKIPFALLDTKRWIALGTAYPLIGKLLDGKVSAITIIDGGEEAVNAQVDTIAVAVCLHDQIEDAETIERTVERLHKLPPMEREEAFLQVFMASNREHKRVFDAAMAELAKRSGSLGKTGAKTARKATSRPRKSATTASSSSSTAPKS